MASRSARCTLQQTLTALSGLLLAASIPAQAEIPLIGGKVREIRDAEEVRVGNGLAGLILDTAPLLDDPAKQRYINRVGRWLSLHCERPDLPWRFGIIDSPNFNAFSMPGGYVLVTRGLVEKMRTESELVGVLSHEIAHVVRRHHLGALHLGAGLIENQASGLLDKLPVQTLREKLGKGALGTVQNHLNPGGEGIAGSLSRSVIEAGRDLLTRGLARDEEFEADAMAVVLAARSGYSPYGLAGVLQTLSGLEGTEQFALHRKTHPGAVDRLVQLDAAMGSQFDGMTGLVDDVPGFAVLRATRRRGR